MVLGFPIIADSWPEVHIFGGAERLGRFKAGWGTESWVAILFATFDTITVFHI